MPLASTHARLNKLESIKINNEPVLFIIRTMYPPEHPVTGSIASFYGERIYQGENEQFDQFKLRAELLATEAHNALRKG